MTATLTFNLPDDATEFRLAQMGGELHGILFDLGQKLRGYLKYGHKFKDADAAIAVIREELHAELDNMNIKFEGIE